MIDLTQDVVRELIDYNPDTGICTWKHRGRNWFKSDRSYKSWNTQHAGKHVGNIRCGSGVIQYRQCKLLNKIYDVHRLIWLYVFGEWPVIIDHKDGDGLNNRLDNLRNVNHDDNMRNASISSNNMSGVCGVRREKGKWRVQIQFNKKRIHIGYFEDFEDAVKSRKKAELEYGFHENHGRERT